MMKNMIRLTLFVVVLISILPAHAQGDTVKRRIAIFAPLYLDSAFNEVDEYRYERNVFPKFINPGLEFYEGAHMALDSLAKEGAPLEVFVYDTRSAVQSLSDQLLKAGYDKVELMIVHCSSAEVRTFAEAGLRMNVPVINANLPNDGGAAGNPYFVMLNPTLKTICEGMYRYAQQYYNKNKLVVFRKKGALEDRVRGYLDESVTGTNGAPLKLKYVELTDSFTVADLQRHLDTVQQTVCIAGSLDENFGRRLIQQLAAARKNKYQALVMGMPTWENIPFSKPEFKGIEIIYANPFYNAKTNKVSESISAFFSRVMFARPSDMVFRGYETTFRFARLLLQYKNDLASNLGNREPVLFTEFDIQPVLNRQTMSLDYFENKKLYFLRWQDGIVKGVN